MEVAQVVPALGTVYNLRFFFQAEDGIRDATVTGVQTCALPIFVVQTVGMMPEDRVWLDTAGRPISDQLRVEERFHRVDHDHLEMTVTIDDPKMYTKIGRASCRERV